MKDLVLNMKRCPSTSLILVPHSHMLREKLKKRSAVWEDFEEVILKNGQVKIQCKHRKSYYTKQTNGSTTTLKKYISRCYKEVRTTTRQQTLSFSQPVEGPSVSIYKYDRESVNEWTTKLIITDERPFQMVESPAFVGLARCPNPKYEKVSRTSIKRVCMKMYEGEKVKLKTISQICLTSDLWMTSNQRKRYMSITAHYVDVEYSWTDVFCQWLRAQLEHVRGNSF